MCARRRRIVFIKNTIIVVITIAIVGRRAHSHLITETQITEILRPRYAELSTEVTTSRYSVLTRYSRRRLRCSVRRPLRWRRRDDVLIFWLFCDLFSGCRLHDYAFTKRWTVIGRASGNGDHRCAQRFRGRHAYARWRGRRRHGYGCQKTAAIFSIPVGCYTPYSVYDVVLHPVQRRVPAFFDDVPERGVWYNQRRSKRKLFPAIYSKNAE